MNWFKRLYKKYFPTREEKEFRTNVKKFCQEIQAWIEGSCKDTNFSSAVGLCQNYKSWSGDREAYEKMGDLFELEGLDRCYPFEQDGMDGWNKKYINVKRLAWIREHM